MNESASEVETIFLAARDVSPPGEREAYLARVCGENRDLRQRIERMLHAEEQADQFLADNPLELTDSPPGRPAHQNRGS